MAETAVNILIEQLATLLIVEAKRLSSVKDGVATIKLDLEMIRAFLVDADQQQHTNEGIKVWIKQLRDTAYRIEDALDEYLYHMEQSRKSGLASLVDKNTRFLTTIPAKRRVAKKVSALRRQLTDINQRRTQFSFIPAASATTNFDDDFTEAGQFAKESEVVGIEKRRDGLIERLLHPNKEYSVISVVGMGGVGKSTLVRNVYEHPRVKNYFASHAWVTVTHKNEPKDVLRKIINQLLNWARAEELKIMDYIQLVATLRDHLNEKRYVIILDDVWDIQALDEIMCAFPDNKKQSRVMVTTRKRDVAAYCSKPRENVHPLEPLDEHTEAWILFCKKVFGAGKECPKNLEQIARKILMVCGGLPLAILAIGGVVSRRQDRIQWESIYQSIGAELETDDSLKKMTRILWRSYHDLPHELKPCFLYFGIFPSGYVIKPSEITRLWIAEGFIKPIPNKSYEEVSKSYLDQLIHRSLVQASELDSCGRVRKCRVHDCLYEIILNNSRDQNFHSYSTQEISTLPENVRRYVVNSGLSVPPISNFKYLRSLLLLGSNGIPQLSTYTALKVLHLKCGWLDTFPTEVYDLFHLRYLYLGDSSYIRTIPKGIKKLRNLQIFCMIGTRVSSLPDEIIELKNLRHIKMWSGTFGVQIPEKLGSLKSLQTLANVDITGGGPQLDELGKLTQLKKLRIERVKATDGEALCKSISNMKQLRSLYLFAGIDSELLDIETLSINYPILRSINLRGLLKKLPGFISSLDSLQKLKLNSSKLKDDPFSLLEKLPSLVELYMYNNAYEGEELHSQNSGFKNLKKLIIQKHLLLRHLVIDKGAMTHLEFLGFNDCGRLGRVPTGIEHLTKLNELSLEFLPEECMNSVRKNEGEDWKKVEHIPIVRKAYQENARF